MPVAICRELPQTLSENLKLKFSSLNQNDLLQSLNSNTDDLLCFAKSALTDQVWLAENPFLAGRLTEITKRLPSSSSGLNIESRNNLDEEPTSRGDDYRYARYLENQEELIQIFTDEEKFLKLIDYSPFLAGRLAEVVAFAVNDFFKSQKKALASPSEFCTKLPLPEIMEAKRKYWIKAEIPQITPDYRGFRALVRYRIGNNAHDELLLDLAEIQIPFSIKRLVLSSKPLQEILQTLEDDQSQLDVYFEMEYAGFSKYCEKFLRQSNEMLLSPLSAMQAQGRRCRTSASLPIAIVEKPKPDFFIKYDAPKVFFQECFNHFSGWACKIGAPTPEFSERNTLQLATKKLLKDLAQIRLPTAFKQAIMDYNPTDAETASKLRSAAEEEFEKYRAQLKDSEREALYWKFIQIVPQGPEPRSL